MYFALACTTAGVLTMLLADWRRWVRVGWCAKPLTSAVFLLTAIALGRFDSTASISLLVGLGASWIGDVALLSDRPRWFLVGVGAFGAAHIAYAIAFLARGVDPAWAAAAAIALVAPAYSVHRWLRPDVPTALARPIRIYIALICGMVALAVGSHARLPSYALLMGAAAFFISDLAVARDRFVHRSLLNRLWGWPLYYTAQLLLASTTIPE